MLKFAVRKIIDLFLVMIGVSLLVFFMRAWIPGDVAEFVLFQSGMEPTPEAIAHVREELGLEAPLYQQYFSWVRGIAVGDFGHSFRTKKPVMEELSLRLPASFQLATVSFLGMLVIVLPLGIFSAVYKGKWVDHISRILATIGASMPSFWLGILLMYFFAVKGRFFSVTGDGSYKDLVLPATTLAIGLAPTYIRLLRTSLVSVLQEDFIVVARSRGLKESTLILTSALKKALLPMMPYFGISFGNLLGGTVVVENIFAWPGVGQFLVLSIFNRDYPVIQAYVLIMALVFVLINGAVDYAYTFLDPQIRVGRVSK